MKTTLIASALIALGVAASGSAFAQRGDHGGDHTDRIGQMQQQNSVRTYSDNGSGSALAERRDQAGDHGDRMQQQNNDRRDDGRAFIRHDDQRNGHYDRNDQAQQRDGDRHDHGRFGPRGNSESHRNDYYAHQYHRDDMRGGGPRHDLRRGQRLSREYRDNRYVVNDWRARRLSAPPRGQHWVRAGNDYVLATIATGLIAQVLLGN